MSEQALSMQPVTHESVWSAAEMRERDDWLHRLDEGEIDELVACAGRVQDRGDDLMALDRDDFPLPRLGPRLADIRREVLHGRGFVQIRGLALGRLGRRGAGVAFWGLGLHVGDGFVSQNAKGHLLGHVTDLGEKRSNPDQRGPYSSDTIPYHVDCCDVVGLLCLHPARRGGESSIVSSGHVYNTLLRRRPDLVEPLLRPVFRDRRGEIPTGMAPWYAIPVFNHHAGLLSVSIEPTYIGSVRRHFGGVEPHSAAQLEGIEMVQAIAHELRFDIAFERGDVQLVNNHAIMHSRQAFEDHPEAARRRHLLRLWMINHDARPLPDAYYERHGRRAEIVRPGGIVGPDTRPVATLP